LRFLTDPRVTTDNRKRDHKKELPAIGFVWCSSQAVNSSRAICPSARSSIRRIKHVQPSAARAIMSRRG
jgi:hypothetical protein